MRITFRTAGALICTGAIVGCAALATPLQTSSYAPVVADLKLAPPPERATEPQIVPKAARLPVAPPPSPEREIMSLTWELRGTLS